jgi:Adenylate kinase and related kinases
METRYKALLMFGPPGAGKGTVGKNLSLVSNHVHVSSGDIFRGISPDSTFGKLQQEYLAKGNLVPDELTLEICKRYIDGLIATNRFYPEKQWLILDGLPRTLNQAKMLDEWLDVRAILSIQMPNEDRLFERLMKRAKIEGRQDDMKPEVLQNRMQVYHKSTKEVLSHYKKEIIHVVNGDQTQLAVFRDVATTLAPLFA